MARSWQPGDLPKRAMRHRRDRPGSFRTAAWMRLFRRRFPAGTRRLHGRSAGGRQADHRRPIHDQQRLGRDGQSCTAERGRQPRSRPSRSHLNSARKGKGSARSPFSRTGRSWSGERQSPYLTRSCFIQGRGLLDSIRTDLARYLVFRRHMAHRSRTAKDPCSRRRQPYHRWGRQRRVAGKDASERNTGHPFRPVRF